MRVFFSLFLIKNLGVYTKYNSKKSTATVRPKTMNKITRHESPSYSMNSNPIVDYPIAYATCIMTP